MGPYDEHEKSNLPCGDPRLRQTAGLISSLHEAWFHTLDTCVIDSPISEVILPLMRNCFFGGAMHAVFLLQKGHGDQLAADIAGFIQEEPQW
jgi:hypothetical protein